MVDLTFEERKHLRRAAEDARDACNRHYGPFVDVVAHPLRILALLDMADRAAQQPSTQDQRDKALEEAARKCEDIYSWLGSFSAGPLQTSALNACAAAIRAMKSTSARAAKEE